MATAAFCGVVALLWRYKVGCPFLSLTGIPCVSCGMTRAVLSALKLDFKGAFEHNPMFWSIPLIYWSVITEMSPFKSKKLNNIFLISLFGIIAVAYALRLCGLI